MDKIFSFIWIQIDLHPSIHSSILFSYVGSQRSILNRSDQCVNWFDWFIEKNDSFINCTYTTIQKFGISTFENNNKHYINQKWQ